MARELLPPAKAAAEVRNLEGGEDEARDVMNYKEPKGPKYINREGPGLRGGINHGNKGSQGRF